MFNKPKKILEEHKFVFKKRRFEKNYVQKKIMLEFFFEKQFRSGKNIVENLSFSKKNNVRRNI